MDLATCVVALTVWLSMPHGTAAWDAVAMTPRVFAGRVDTADTLVAVPLITGPGTESWRQTEYRIGLLDVTAPARSGTPMLYPAVSSLASVRTTLTPDSTPGLSIDLVPRSAEQAWHGNAGAAFSPAAAVPASGPPPIAAVRRFTEATLSGGRLAGTHAGSIFAAFDLTRSTHRERDETYDLPGNVLSLATHAGVAAGAASHADAFAWIQRTETPFAGRLALATRDVAAAQHFDGFTAAWRRGTARPLDVEAGLQHARSTPDVSGDVANGTIERLLDGPVQELAAEGRRVETRWSAAAAISPSRGRHALAVTLEVNGAAADLSGTSTGSIGETVDGMPARAWTYGYSGASHRRETVAALSGRDTISVGSHFSLDAGLRLEHVSASARASTSQIAWTDAAPRLAVRFAAGPWTAAVLGRRALERLPLDVLAFGDPAAPAGRVFRWTDPNGDGRVEADEIGSLIALMGPGSREDIASAIDPAIRRPRRDEIFAAAERRFGKTWSARVTASASHTRDGLAAADEGVPFAAYTSFTVADPGLDLLGPGDNQQLTIYSRPPATFGGDRYLLTNADASNGSAEAVTVLIATSGAGPLQLLASGTAVRSHGVAAYRGYHAVENDDVLPGDAYADPNSRTNADGRPFLDRGYGATVAASWRAPRAITVAAVARYADGQPFARMVVVPDLPQGPEAVRAYANGRSRFTYAFTLDLRIAKRLRLGTTEIEGAIDAFNALDTSHEVEEDIVTGPAFRTPTALQPPRVLRLSLAARF